MQICLTKEEIVEITGCKTKKTQLRWFSARGFCTETRADGMPIITRKHFEWKMGGLQGNATDDDLGPEPDFEALDAPEKKKS